MFFPARKTLFVAGFCLFLSFNDPGPTEAEIQRGDYLWLDYGAQDDQGGVGESQRLFICYGQLPDKRRDISELGQPEVFCTFGEKDKQGAPIYYKLNVEYRDGRPCVIIKSQKDTWCGVLCKAFRKDAKMACFYTASTSFFLQGNSGKGIDVDKEEYNHDILAGGIDIELLRERIKEDSTIYRQIGFPLGFTVRFSGKPLSNRGVLVVDDVGKVVQLKTNWRGKFAYLPGGLGKFREDVIIIGHEDKDYLYKSSYTVFFRYRRDAHTPAIMRNLNIPLGLIIFFASVFAGFVLALITKRKFSYEDL